MQNNHFCFQYVSWMPLAELSMQHHEAALQTKKLTTQPLAPKMKHSGTS